MQLELPRYIADPADPEALALAIQLLARDVAPQLPRRSAFRAYRSAALSLAAGNQNVVMDRVEYDYEQEYDPVTGIFQPRRSGVYHITAGVGANTNQATGVPIELKVYRNGVRERYFRYDTLAAVSAPQYNGADDFLLKAGDQLQVVVAFTANSGGNTSILTGTSGTWFSARHVRDE